MMRTALTIVCVVCVATVITEILGLCWLSFRGQLTADTVHDIRSVLAGTQSGNAMEADAKEKIAASNDDYDIERSTRIWDLQGRQEEIGILKTMVTEKADQLTATKDAFEKHKQAFLDRLKVIDDSLVAESTQQAQGILSKMQPNEAVNNLLALDLDQNVRLLKGMPEKSIAKILQEFLNSKEKKHVERGNQIFAAIVRGEPSRTVLEGAKKQFPAPAQPAAQPATN